MCGIAGIFSPHPPSLDDLAAMSAAIAHRGPDDAGIWSDQDAGIALAHRRLSIVDLSAAGHQPMMSVDRRYVLVFNGEIYNFGELRRALVDRQGASSWRGGSDTEVLLRAIDQWGLTEALRRADGMFALALWDRERRCLRLARDRIGEKPLYVGRAGSEVIFGSTLAALRAHAAWRGSIDRVAVAELLRFGYIRAPRSIYDGVIKLPPGRILTLHLSHWPSFDPVRLDDSLECYWSLDDAAAQGLAQPLSDEQETILDQVEQTLATSVAERMVADVPLGAFLSGGVDSSLVAALMQQAADAPVQTFTIGFDVAGFNEAPHAHAVARHLGTQHTDLYVTGADALAEVPGMAGIFDEPFADPSQVPTVLLSRLTRRHVTVALSGDGGDELFSGYDRYRDGQQVWHAFGRIPAPLRRGLCAVGRALPAPVWDALGRVGWPLGSHIPELGRRAHRFAERLMADGFDDYYANLVAVAPAARALVRGLEGSPTHETLVPAGIAGHRRRMMFRDQVDYLPDDILCKVDRASMAVALEVRVPMLGRSVVELTWRLPMSMLWRHGGGKWVLRQILYRYVPASLVDRPKQGFGVPVAAWLRGPLREWAEDLLAEERLRRQGLLVAAPVQRLWRAHLAGRGDHGLDLWALLMLQAWLDQG